MDWYFENIDWSELARSIGHVVKDTGGFVQEHLLLVAVAAVLLAMLWRWTMPPVR